MKAQVLFFIIVSAILFSSCQHCRIEKRRYSSGYYIHSGSDNDKKGAIAREETPVVVTEEKTAAIPVEVVVSIPASTQTGPAEENSKTPDAAEKISAAPSEETIAEPATPTVTESVPPARQDAPASGAPHDSDVALVLLVILAILLPPLAVYLVEGITNRFWITLILCILGGGFFFSPYIGGLYLIAIIIALLVVFGAI